MNWKIYIPISILILAFFGVSLDKSVVPNQEIIVQFDGSYLNAEQSNNTISEITDQLTAIGATDIHVSEIENGTLKVTYFSTVDVSIIKNLFQNEQQLKFEDTAFNENSGSTGNPFNKNQSNYKLEVAKITSDFSSDIGLHGLPVEVKAAKDQYLNTFISLGLAENTFNFPTVIQFNFQKYYGEVTLQFSTTSYKIPQVRAGPVS